MRKQCKMRQLQQGKWVSQRKWRPFSYMQVYCAFLSQFRRWNVSLSGLTPSTSCSPSPQRINVDYFRAGLKRSATSSIMCVWRPGVIRGTNHTTHRPVHQYKNAAPAVVASPHSHCPVSWLNHPATFLYSFTPLLPRGVTHTLSCKFGEFAVCMSCWIVLITNKQLLKDYSGHWPAMF